MINRYLQQFSYFPQKVTRLPADSLSMVIVIPARREEDLIYTLDSLYSANKPIHPFEVIVVFNHPENEIEELKKENYKYLDLCNDWIREKGFNNIFIIEAFDLPKKHAGVGLARKIGMDEAVRRLINNDDGIIVALDADCLVAANYLTSIEAYFELNKECNAASIYFEHRFEDMDDKLLDGIIQYELHLRYYNQLLKYAGHPFAYHTVGSSMVVRSSVYQKQGGMNKRKAGEDFYFLQKIIQLGNYGEINTTTVYPSSRVSDRVPFGTGRAQGEWLEGVNTELQSYHSQVGDELKLFFQLINEKGMDVKFESFPKSIRQFIGEREWEAKAAELIANTRSSEAYIQRFYLWFNLFMCFKYVHFYRDNFQNNIGITIASASLLKKLNINVKEEGSLALMKKFRKLERG